ncbi:hypothetical protein C8J57DRAFT_281722 [Mycena rebaudengoi]|nr:hypothetical protein C8J57DRAFT_281722 [Mycena rebaudengoi]
MDIPSVSESSEPQRAEGLWFEDCGLIIQAEATLFRVSRDILAARSAVFRDMLSIPTPADAEMMFGCPFVRLPDSAEDVSYFLKALFDYEFFNPFPASTTFPILAGVLRMSHKYEVEALRRRALVHLSSAHPTKLEDYHSVDKLRSWPYDDSETIPIILLAQQVSAEWIIPTAMYRLCAAFDEAAILRGYIYHGSQVKLSESDQLSAFIAMRSLSTETSVVLSFLWDLFDGCLSTECIMVRLAARRASELWREDMMPLNIWVDEDFDIRLGSSCDVCLPQMKLDHQEALQSFWDRLPAIFQMPPWAELE